MEERRYEPGSPDYESTTLNHYTTLVSEDECMHMKAHTNNKLCCSLRCYWKDFLFYFVSATADQHGYLLVVRILIMWDMNENTSCRTVPDKESLGWLLQSSLGRLVESKAIDMTKGVDGHLKRNPWAWADRG